MRDSAVNCKFDALNSCLVTLKNTSYSFILMMLFIPSLALVIACSNPASENSEAASASVQPQPDTNKIVSKPAPELLSMKVNEAVMVTVELDFGQPVPSIASGLKSIERRYEPADGKGRTFAILDAYGEPTPDGKLHMSMHVSSEKPGKAMLLDKRNGEILWQSMITADSGFTVKEKGLLIYVDNLKGGSYTVVGQGNPSNVLEALFSETNKPVKETWKDGEVREVTFVYSACGCPVKAKVKRTGATTIRTSELPVMFPDDPGAVQVINRLMGWK